MKGVSLGEALSRKGIFLQVLSPTSLQRGIAEGHLGEMIIFSWPHCCPEQNQNRRGDRHQAGSQQCPPHGPPCTQPHLVSPSSPNRYIQWRHSKYFTTNMAPTPTNQNEYPTVKNGYQPQTEAILVHIGKPTLLIS